MLYYAELINKKSKKVRAIGVAKHDQRGFYKFNLIPTMNSKPFINITTKSNFEIVLGEMIK